MRKDLTILVVTHDRAFLEEVCNRILELDQGSLYQYEGSYAAYLRGKEERLAVEDAAVSSARAKYRVELDWMRRQPQVRSWKFYLVSVQLIVNDASLKSILYCGRYFLTFHRLVKASQRLGSMHFTSWKRPPNHV